MSYLPNLFLHRDQTPRWATQGFTLLEVLVVLIVISILLTIAVPSWLKFWTTRQVVEARNELRLGILDAQNSAIATRSSWRFSLREADGHLEWATHANDVSWQRVQSWKPLPPGVVIDSADTTLAQKDGVYYVRFSFKGNVAYRLSTVTLDSRNGVARNQCVVISTLIGATRKGQEQPVPNGKRYCY